VIEAVKNKQIRHFFLVGGCDGAKPGRNYYTEFVEKTRKDTIVLTLACGKFRFFDKELGDIGGIRGCLTSVSAMMPTLQSKLLWRWPRPSMWA